MRFHDYDPAGFFDELFDADGSPRIAAEPLIRQINSLPDDALVQRQIAAERALFNQGITFSVYGEQASTERIIPFDIVPRIIAADDWAAVEEGLKQRITALNLFIEDIHHDAKILADKVVPADLVPDLPASRMMQGRTPPRGVWPHIAGIDLVRERDGRFYVLEDNLRCPSGVSYVLENRRVLKRTFPYVFGAMKVQPVDDYPERLLETLEELASDTVERPCVVVLTPGIFNSAYFEHAYLAQQMGVPLVEGRDLVVSGGQVMMRTTHGLRRVDVIYRRVDDEFLDPLAFRPDSVLGVPGLMQAYLAGKVAIANAPGCGVADDKVICAFVPAMVKYYLGQDAILPNVETFLCGRPKDRQYVLERLDKLVVKPAREAGGKGILVGPHASERERAAMAEKIQQDPMGYIAQPTLALSRAPTIVGDRFEGRHVDLRPYVLFGKEIYVLPGGLTRVALKKGSLVVNSSQGGGTKDTWVVDGFAQERNAQGQWSPSITLPRPMSPDAAYAVGAY